MALVVVASAGGCGVVTADNIALPPAFDDAGLGISGSLPAEALDASTSCRVSSPLAFSAGNYRPAVRPSAACVGPDGGLLWADFYGECLGPNKDSAACADFKTSHAACASCIVTPFAADSLGPILDYGEYVGGNIAGCIELEVPGDPTCPKAVQALTECELAACAANCPVTDPASLSARNQCAMDADRTACRSLFQMATSCRAGETEAGVGPACALGPFKDFYDAVVPLFCGLVPGEGGAGYVGAADATAEGNSDAGVADAARGDAAEASDALQSLGAGPEYDARGD